MSSPRERPGKEERADDDYVARLRDEGLLRSRVMEWAQVLSDVHGPRYANSPAYDAASEWARDTLGGFPRITARLEEWGEYGYGWENRYTSAHMLEPRYQPLIAYPLPGTESTEGKVEAEVVLVDTTRFRDDSDLAAWQGRLRGKIVLAHPPRALQPNFEPHAVRLADEELRAMRDGCPTPQGPTSPRGFAAGTDTLSSDTIADFLRREGVAAILIPGQANVGPMDKGLVNVAADGPLPVGVTPAVPMLVVAAEHYNRMARLIAREIRPVVEVEVRNVFHDDDPQDRNVLADLAGTDLANEIVMIGGHLDSESAGTGATDNAAGAAVVIEAMRLLSAMGVTPRRTIRAALWGAEEAGALGSRGYVARHLGGVGGREALPGHSDFYVYFNVDWYGRLRGVFLQGNALAGPIFEKWMTPFHDLGMKWLIPGNTGGTDHVSFLEAGLPAFQFVQDDLEFFNVSFHTNMDVYDRLVPDDLQQAAVILASFAFHAAMREGPFPHADGLDNDLPWHK